MDLYDNGNGDGYGRDYLDESEESEAKKAGILKFREDLITLCDQLESDMTDDLKYYKPYYLDNGVDIYSEYPVIFHVRNIITAEILDIDRDHDGTEKSILESYYDIYDDYKDSIYGRNNDVRGFIEDMLQNGSDRGNEGFFILKAKEFINSDNAPFPRSTNELINREENTEGVSSFGTFQESSTSDPKYWTDEGFLTSKPSLYISKTLYGAVSLIYQDPKMVMRKFRRLGTTDQIEYFNKDLIMWLLENGEQYQDKQPERDNQDKYVLEKYAVGDPDDDIEPDPIVRLVQNQVYTYQVPTKSALKR